MVTTKHKLVIDTQKIKKKESKHTTKELCQTTEAKEEERSRDELPNSQKTINWP